MMKKKTWQNKASEIISELCMAEYRQSNIHNGDRQRKHRPYEVPNDAQFLIKCLNKNDEEGAKSLFMKMVMIDREARHGN